MLPVLRHDVVHLHTIPQDAPAPPDASTLSPAEHARADRLPPLPRRRFLVRHAAVRGILARYAGDGRGPGDLPLVADEYGRPWWEGGPVDFNLAHRGPWAVLAVAAAGGPGVPAVGVDLESVPIPADGPRLVELAAAFFTDAELAELDAVSVPTRPGRIVRLWSAKEAVLKAAGCGLHRPATAVAVEWCQAGVGRARCGGRPFALVETRPATGCVAVVAVPGTRTPGIFFAGPAIAELPIDRGPADT